MALEGDVLHIEVHSKIVVLMTIPFLSCFDAYYPARLCFFLPHSQIQEAVHGNV